MPSSLRAVFYLLLISTGGIAASQPPPGSKVQEVADSLSSPGSTGLDTAVSMFASDSLGTTLVDFFSAAIDYSPSLGIAQEDLNIQAAKEDAALRRLLPQVSASASVTENRREAVGVVERFRGERYALALSQVLFNWEVYAARRRARHLEVMRQAQYFHELSLLLTQVADRYLDVLQAQEAVASIRAELEAVASQVEQIQHLYDRQLVPVTDLRRAQASMSSVRADRAVLLSELDLAREALRAGSGLPAGELHTLREDAAVSQSEEDIQHWVGLALEKNWELEAGRQSVKAAAAGVSQGKGTLMPNLSLILLHQNSNVGFDNAPIRRSDISYIGINATVPLFSGGGRWASIREARSTRARSEHELHQIELDIRGRVRRTYLQLRASKSLVEAAESLVDATTLTVTSMQRGFSLGTVTNVEVLSAIRDQFRAERDLQKIRHDEIRHFLLLKHESGTLTSDDMVAVSDWFQETGL